MASWGPMPLALLILVLVSVATSQDLSTVATEFNIHQVAAANSTSEDLKPHDAKGQFTWRRTPENYDSQGKRLVGHVIAEFQETTFVTQCALKCRYSASCRSFNFNKDLKKCELNSQDDLSAAQDINDDGEFEFIRKGTFQIAQESLSLCAQHPCQNDGRCLETNRDGVPGYLCICTDDWTGEHCTDDAGSIDWDQWSDWTPCSVSCGRGWQRRSRDCVHTSGQKRSVFECFGTDIDFRICEPKACPRWQDWGEWGPCSSSDTCGAGNKARNRTCENQGKPGVDRLCMGPTQETAPCTTPACDGAIRLRGGSTPGEGVIEIHNDLSGSWGRICASGWTKQSADIACKQLGFHKGALDVDYKLGNNVGNGRYMLSDVKCSGKEDSIQACKHAGWTDIFTCPADKSAGVRCIVDGGFSKWTKWSECSVTCAEGTMTRTRQCNLPLPQRGGEDCKGVTSESKVCSLEACPTDGSRWHAWSTWSACTATCGGGTKTRVRSCDGDPSNCNGEGEETELCNMFACTDQGVWSHWMEWGHCDSTCGGGTSQRERVCLGKGGKDVDCVGHQVEYKPCSVDECPDTGTGSWRKWSKWDSCNSNCGGGVRMRNRDFTCTSSGSCDQTAQTQKYTCNAHPCPVDGYYLPWSEWTSCNKTCGGGWRSRDRNCVAPLHGGKECKDIGVDFESEMCNTHACPVNGYWEPWGKWQACSKTCGGGNQVRNRLCVEPAHGGSSCQGEKQESRDCNTHECPVHCTWNDWEPWQPCNVTCSNGWQLRLRSKNDEQHGGDPCSGAAEEWRECFPRDCPVNCVWHEWSPWEHCNVTCNDGWQRRSRAKDDGLFGGNPCQGPAEEWQPCNPRPCPIDGTWEPWTDWSTCSVSCNNGTKERSRTCNYGLHGGANCTGPNHEIEDCFLMHCPIDGVWSKWSDWEVCSTTCGDGTQKRGRTCHEPKYNGKPCEGPAEETKACFLRNCPVAGVWLEWSDWGSCNRVCGGGNQTRHRECEGPFYQGEDCVGSEEDIQLCNTQPCPENGYWELWTTWSVCSLTCGQGASIRTRECIPPKNGGATCDGDGEQEINCNENPCPVDGVWKEWEEWATCNATCGGGWQSRQRPCVEPQHGGLECQGPAEEWQSCNEHPCPVDGTWEPWSKWFDCNETCGGGVQNRKRKCYAPLHGGKGCDGNSEEWQDCNTHNCPVDGVWSKWSEWGECNVPCAGGLQNRSRDCTPPLYGGQPCQGPEVDSKICNENPCPVNAYWKAWNKWESCSVTCGGGTQVRRRDCVPGLHGGIDCQGDSQEQRSCNDNPCPVDCTWQLWSDWSPCNVTCGPGTRMRSRDKNEALHGGNDCPGDALDVEGCNLRTCMIPGEWAAWMQWSRCTVSCGGGTRVRSRDCNMTSYGDLTSPCIGETKDVGQCHTYPCSPLAYSCGGWVAMGMVDTNLVEVDPDGDEKFSLQPFWVNCDTSVLNGSSAIRHKYDEKIKVQGYEGAGQYQKKIPYKDAKNNSLSIDQIAAYVDASNDCSQYISWDCHSSSIHSSVRRDLTTVFWKNRYLEPVDYWGGTVPGSRSCPCGVHRTCADPDLLCNCDSNDATWRNDAGNITHKDDLPVSVFQAGDTGADDEIGLWFLGPLICRGHNHTYVASTSLFSEENY